MERSDRDVMGRGEEGGVEGGGCLCLTDDIGPRAVIQHMHTVSRLGIMETRLQDNSRGIT